MAAAGGRIPFWGLLEMSVLTADYVSWIKTVLGQGQDLPNQDAKRLLSAYETLAPGPLRDKILRSMAKDPSARNDMPDK
jgi:hypothetical protein